MSALLGCTLKFGGIDLCCEPRGAITLHHQVHDRGTAHLFRRGLAGHWCIVGQEHGDGQDVSLHSLLQWQTSIGCALHDAHNALRWGFQSTFGHD
eukprot:3523629-Amphidinium_carterae.1